ncbi:MAG: hypothetical protein ACR2IQ_02490 [Minisyncoccia bacterium]
MNTTKIKALLTDGRVSGISNYLVNHTKEETGNNIFFMDQHGEYVGPGYSELWHTAMTKWEPKPEIIPLSEHLVEASDKIAAFIKKCRNNNIKPDKYAWENQNHDIMVILRNQNMTGMEKLRSQGINPTA